MAHEVYCIRSCDLLCFFKLPFIKRYRLKHWRGCLMLFKVALIFSGIGCWGSTRSVRLGSDFNAPNENDKVFRDNPIEYFTKNRRS